LFICIAILLVVGAFVYAENKKEQVAYVAKDVVSADGTIVSPQEVDTDEDGSKDWEEILFGTNPNDPKSKPSATKAPVTSDVTTNATEKLEPIDIVSRDFFARYLELRQLGASKDKDSQEELAKTVAGNIVLSEPAKYVISEIQVKPDSGNAGVIKYGEEVSAIFKKYAINSRNEAVIAKESLEKEDTDILKEIDPSIKSYKNIINALIKVSVPQSMSLMHLDLVNAMNGSLFVAQSFRDSGANPVEGVQALSYYQVVEKNLYDAVTAIRSYFKYLGIYENIF